MPQGPANSSPERIFISIAAFRDPETRWTVHELLQKARKPDRLRIGIVWQVDTASEADMMDLPIPASQKSQVGSMLNLMCALKHTVDWTLTGLCAEVPVCWSVLLLLYIGPSAHLVHV